MELRRFHLGEKFVLYESDLTQNISVMKMASLSHEGAFSTLSNEYFDNNTIEDINVITNNWHSILGVAAIVIIKPS